MSDWACSAVRETPAGPPSRRDIKIAMAITATMATSPAAVHCAFRRIPAPLCTAPVMHWTNYTCDRLFVRRPIATEGPPGIDGNGEPGRNTVPGGRVIHLVTEYAESVLGVHPDFI